MYPNLSPQGYNIIHDPSPTPSPDTMYLNSPEVYYNPQLTPESNWETGPSTSRGPTRSPLMQNPPFQMNVVNPSFPTVSPTQFETPRQLQYELPPAGGQFGQWEGAPPDDQTIFNMDDQTINSADMANIPDLNNLSLSDIVPDVTSGSLTEFVNSRVDDMNRGNWWQSGNVSSVGLGQAWTWPPRHKRRLIRFSDEHCVQHSVLSGPDHLLCLSPVIACLKYILLTSVCTKFYTYT